MFGTGGSALRNNNSKEKEKEKKKMRLRERNQRVDARRADYNRWNFELIPVTCARL